MAHENKHTKTKEGYLIAIEDLLNTSLPLVYWRLKIDRAFLLWDCLTKKDYFRFYFLCGMWGLPFVSKQLKFEE